MRVVGATAPDLEALHPNRQYAQRSVYPGLIETLLEHDGAAHREIAHLLATCSGYAYGDEVTVATMMARMGLPKNRCLRISESIDAMLIRATAQLVQSQDGRVVILCFRGTELLDVINWLADLDISPGPAPLALPGTLGLFDVHGGFYRNLRSIRYEVIRALNDALAGRRIGDEGPDLRPMEALYLTGHSLGGAMAALMSIMIRAEPGYAEIARALKATYTFGQPMIGGPDFARAGNADPFLRDRVFRYIYNRDVAAQLPPTFTGEFAHFGQEYQYLGREPDGHWRHNATPMPPLRGVIPLLLSPVPIVTKQITRFKALRFKASFEDHFPRHYVGALAGTASEFGP